MSGLNRKDDAEREARNLIALLKGTGWKPRVWDNMGWHYKAVSGPIQVYPSILDGKFWCMIGSRPKDTAGGAGFWTPQRTRCFKDPNRAVKDALGYVYPFVEQVNQTLKAAERAAGIAHGKNGKDGRK